MNGKLNQFVRGKLDIPDFETYFAEIYPQIKDSFEKAGKTEYEDVKSGMKVQYDILLKDEIWLNDEYQVNIDKSIRASEMVVWHLSIKRRDKEPIHDWRDLQAIKNMLVGEEYEGCELYPAESRLVDSANQYHLWVLVSHPKSNKPPKFPFGFTYRNVTSEIINGGKQREL